MRFRKAPQQNGACIHLRNNIYSRFRKGNAKLKLVSNYIKLVNTDCLMKAYSKINCITILKLLIHHNNRMNLYFTAVAPRSDCFMH